DGEFQKHAEKIVPLAQNTGAAALLAGDSRVVGRTKADGLHITGGAAEISEAVEKYADKLIVGGGNAADRHHALEIGEERPE
ncbi:thiamine phosphate synthase, partial [Variovorax sp. CT11-76]